MEEPRAPRIIVIATKYGLIQGLLSFIVFLVRTLAHIKQDRVSVAVDTALLILLMVLAQREFKKKRGGMMTYPQGLGCGTLLSSAAAVVTSALV